MHGHKHRLGLRLRHRHGSRLRGIEANKLLQENQNSHIDPLTF